MFTRTTRLILAALAAALIVPPVASASAAQQSAATWHLVWASDFAVNAPLGSFNATHGTTCPALPTVLRSAWGAYPQGSPDTSSKRGTGLPGYYDPQTTVWVSGGILHVRMWRGSSGSLHAAALLPLAAKHRTYGKYVLTLRVLAPTIGYKTVVMLWAGTGREVDFPENQYTQDMFAYAHTGGLPQRSYDSGVPWSSGWHTATLDWAPGSLKFYMDGRLIGSTTAAVPSYPMQWVLQSEAALNGQIAAPNSSAELEISYAAYYAYG